MKPHAFLLLLSLMTVALALPARAELDWSKPDSQQPVQTESVGGNGGSSFSEQCPPRTWLRGFEVRSGNWIDAIALECGRPLESNGTLTLGKPFGAGAMVGGQGGSLGSGYCGANEGIGGIQILESSGHYVGYIGFLCRSLTELYVVHPTDDFGVTWGAQPRESLCPGGTVAFGIWGRAGSYVDRLGLICAPPPSVRHDLPPSRPPPVRHLPGTEVREPAGGGYADAACPKPIIGDPGIIPPPPMSGTYETDFGTLTLGGNGGSYSYKSGHVCIAKIVANFMEGTWTQSESGQRCADGTYHGHFRFTFNKDGFTGTYGYCEGALNAGTWNGRRL